MYIGIDIGGTNTRIGLFSSLASPDFTLLARFPTQLVYEAQLEHIHEIVRDARIAHIEGIGVSIGGRVVKDGSAVAMAPNLLSYVGRPFVADLRERWQCEVRLAHDPVCGVLAEKYAGALQPYDRCAYLTLSTGTGAAFHLSTGTTNLTVSIEIGHQILDGNTLPCLCGQVGCLETYTGGKQLELRLGHPLSEVQDMDFWHLFCQKLALGIINLAQLARVEVIAVSGAIALQNTFLLPLLKQCIDERIHGMSVHILPAQLGENAPLIGAVTLLGQGKESIVH